MTREIKSLDNHCVSEDAEYNIWPNPSPRPPVQAPKENQ